ncbi:MAG: insulinase family protein, partial [Spirochaetaceae bacterium]|nr:insulinase family protein [Spirochaetaceae bacterium]
WASCYHPSNCRVYLYGNFDTERQLAFLEERFLSRSEPGKAFSRRAPAPELPLEQPFKEPLRVNLPCPASEGSEGTTSIIVNWLAPPSADSAESLGLEVLSEILLGHDGSPLAKALRDSGLGEDLSPHCGLDLGFRQPIFTAGLRGAKRGDEAKIEKIIVDRLEELAREGIAAEALEAAIHSIAFSNREIRRGAGTFGLRLLNRAMRGWIHGAHPEETLSFERPMAALRERMSADPRYLEELALRLIARNPHRSTVTAYPDPGLFERREAERRAELDAREAKCSAAEREAIRAASAKLAASQEEGDPPERVALLPRLAIRDIPREIDIVPRERAEVLGRPVSIHPLFTNGIVYLELAFPLDALPREDFLWLPLLSRFISSAGLPGLSYDKVAERLARNAGGFGAMLDSGTPLRRVAGDGAGGARHVSEPTASFMIFRLKALAEKFPAALELAAALLAGADSGDLRRVADLLAELGNDVVSAFVPAGNSFALARAGAPLSDALAIEELWRGTSQFQFLRALRGRGAAGAAGAADSARYGADSGAAADSEATAASGPNPSDIPAEVEEAAAFLDALRRNLVVRRGLRLNLTASREDLPKALAALEASLGVLPEAGLPPPRSSHPLDPAARSEGYAIPAQVGYAAAALPASRLGSDEYVHESILAHYLSTGPLWDEIRVKRGAYGASCYGEPLEGAFLLSTYRDPSPVDSLVFFGEALRIAGSEGAAAAIDSGRAEEAVIGAAGKDVKPLLPEERGFYDWKRELYGIDDDLRRAKRAAILATGAPELRGAARRLAEAYGAATSVLISRAEDVQL